MKIRIRFKKEGIMKFIGHLDMMRYFQKVFRKANVDIQYSQGFSPHQLISFASPLGVGLTSEGEYMDIFVNTTESSEAMIQKINAVMVEGVSITSFKHILDETKHSNAMSLIAAADYKIAFRDDKKPDFLDQNALDAFMAQSQIIVTKKTKKSTAQTDIKPMIHELRMDGNDIFMKVSTGSAANLKPELLLSALYEQNGSVLDEYDLLIHRMDMYAVDPASTGFVSLDDLGEMIQGV